MKIKFGFFILIVVCVSFFQAVLCGAQPHFGPIEVRNQFPPHMFFLTPRPHSPQTLEKNGIEGSAELDYFSVYSNAASSSHRILMDMEAVVLGFRFAYGITDGFTFSVHVPLVSMNDGFLDGPLEVFHKTFGLPNYGKEKSSQNKFSYMIKKDDQLWFDGREGGLNLCDLTMRAKVRLLESDAFSPLDVGLTYEVKAPSGNVSYGFGSGAWDHGLFLPVKYGFKNINAYFMPGYIMLGRPRFDTADISVKDIISLFVGGEYIYSSKTNLVMQFNSYTSPFERTGIEKLDTPSLELALGARRAFSSVLGGEIAFCEDLTDGAPDFTIHFRLNLLIK